MIRQPHPYVLYIHSSEHMGGCEAYRIDLPADALRKRGRVVDQVHYQTLQEKRYRPDDLRAYDIFVLARSGFAYDRVTNYLRAYGSKFVLEVDDDFTNRYRTVIPENIHRSIWHFARNTACAIVCSTSYLADLMAAETGRPTFVLPNSVRPDDWRVKKRQRLTISLTGSNTHGADWAVLADVLPQIMLRYPQVDLLVAGFLPDYLKRTQVIYPERIIWHEWIPFRNYPAVAGSAHIVLCPVDPDDGFNRSKSGLKAIEGMASQAAVVATDMQIYRDVIVQGRTGLLVPHEPDAWLGALTQLIEDADHRMTLAARGQEHVGRHYNIFKNASLWWDAFRRIKEL